jgi:solute carrier family 25 (mitochondrial phosphate transporter), member 23/24/25/41
MVFDLFLGSTYPLDLVRARLSIATASIPKGGESDLLRQCYLNFKPFLSTAASSASGYMAADLTMWGMTLKVVREEGGIRALYRGIATTAMGVAPYVGINFAAYEALRGVITPPGKTSVVRKLTCGALAGGFACSRRELVADWTAGM